MPRLRVRPFLSTLAIACLGTLVACGSDDPVGLGVGTGHVTALVDGVPWTALTAIASSSSGIVGVGASAVSGEGIGFAFQGDTTGTYTFGAMAVANGNYSVGGNSWLAGGGNGSGAIVVTTLSASRVAGTFAFEAVTITGATPATHSITQGAFDVAF